MIHIPTVLILGAGASAEYGFPVGRQFKNEICALIKGGIYTEMQELGLYDQTREFLDRLLHSPFESPDRFLEEFPDYREVGKYCFAKVLCRSETDELAFPINRPIQAWYEFLVNCLELKSPDYQNNALSILTFNYDRSLEYFLWKAIEALHLNDNRKMRRLWRTKPKIIHLHGMLGAFDPINGAGRSYMPLEERLGVPDELIAAANGINIIHDVDPETEEFDEAEKVLRQAKRIFFLGFGFDKRNVQRLRVFENELNDVAIAGTGRGFRSEADQDRLQNEIFNGYTKKLAFGFNDIREFLNGAQLTSRPPK